MTVAFTSQVEWESRSPVKILGRFRIVFIPISYRYHQIFKVYRCYAHIWREEIAKTSIPPKLVVVMERKSVRSGQSGFFFFCRSRKDSRKVQDRSLPKTPRVYAALEFVPGREKIAGEHRVAIQPNSHQMPEEWPPRALR